MLERGRHTLQHTTVHLDRAAINIQLDRFASILRGLANHAVQTIGDTFEFLHSCTQQIPLQIPCLAGLRHQIILGQLHRALQAALHRSHVIDGLGHHARQLLHTRESVKLQGVEPFLGILGLLHARLHLRFGLELHIAQLLPQAIQVAG